MPSQPFPTPAELHARLSQVMITDRRKLQSTLARLSSTSSAQPNRDTQILSLIEEFESSIARATARRASIPKPSFTADLPVLARRDEIANLIASNQVCVICGETGSGKTTQIPQICLDLGRGAQGMIGHTQPRRIAARAVAQRLAEELGTTLSAQSTIGYKVRFGDETSAKTLVKLMTDGILLAETAHDRDLLAYDTLIIDEAHERSLNIDFLLGYLKQLLPRRPDLKIIITSATIDPQRLSQHFGGPTKCPVIEVSGRTFPVEIRYHSVNELEQDDFEFNEEEAILSAVDELTSPKIPPGDILVFLPGEREIRLTKELLDKHVMGSGIEVLPLYARMSPSDQQRIFQPHRTGSRIVLATNVAETSLTVPGIRYVIDTGLARISRYSHRTKVQRLPIENISQASANQRAGRCGRVAAGICIRLYTQQDFQSRPAFTDPEILRTNLAAVILAMKALRLGPVEEFPFVEPPDSRMIRDGYDTLHELGAIDETDELTALGKRLAKLPVDPRIGRMLIAGQEESCLADILVIASALAVQDPRDRPMEKQQAADAAHANFKHESSDFLSLVLIWQAYQKARDDLSHSRLRAWCRDHYLSFNRMREWEETHNQLRRLCDELGMDPRSQVLDSRAKSAQSPPHNPAKHKQITDPDSGITPLLGSIPKQEQAKGRIAAEDAIHRALLPGLLSNILQKNDASTTGEYFGARNIKAQVFPGSTLFKKGAKWLVCAELVQTTKLFSRTNAKINPEWIERCASHVLKKSHTDVHFHEETGRVCAWERVTLYGLILVPRRRVDYAKVNPIEAREVFIDDALVNGTYQPDAPWSKHNAAILQEAHRIEAKLRTNDIWAEKDAFYDFFDKRVGPNISTTHQFEAWRKEAERANSKVLFLSLADIIKPNAASQADDTKFPDYVPLGQSLGLLDYHLQPGKPTDGITLTVPIESLPSLDNHQLEWLVPGLLKDKILALLKTLPKQHRTLFVGSKPEAKNDDGSTSGGLTSLAEELASSITFGKDRLAIVLSDAVSILRSVDIPPAAWQLTSVPEHLRMNIKVVDDHGGTIAESRDVEKLKLDLAGRAKKALAGLAKQQFSRDNIKAWDFDDLPESLEVQRAGSTVKAFPTIVDMGDSVSLSLAETPQSAARETHAGIRRLFVLACKDELLHRIRSLPDIEQMYKQFAPLGDPSTLKLALMDLIAERTFLTNHPAIRSKDQFDSRQTEQWGRLGQMTIEVGSVISRILAARQQIASRLSKGTPKIWDTSLNDIREQNVYLLPAGFLNHLPYDRLMHYPRYLQAVLLRLDKLRESGTARESTLLPQFTPVWKRFTSWVANAMAEQKRRLEAQGDQLEQISKASAKASTLPNVRRKNQQTLSTDAGVFAIEPSNLTPELESYRWMLEELRVSLFAQELGTAIPVSPKRLDDAWSKVRP